MRMQGYKDLQRLLLPLILAVGDLKVLIPARVCPYILRVGDAHALVQLIHLEI